MSCVCMVCLGTGKDDFGDCLMCGGTGTWAVSQFAAWDGRPREAALLFAAERKKEKRSQRTVLAHGVLDAMAGRGFDPERNIKDEGR